MLPKNYINIKRTVSISMTSKIEWRDQSQSVEVNVMQKVNSGTAALN